MTIRKLLERLDKALTQNETQKRLLFEAREEILKSVQAEAAENPIAGRVGCHEGVKKKTRAA